MHEARFLRITTGTVAKISPDRMTDPVTNAPYYEAIVDLDDTVLRAEGIKLIPGMAASAAIVTGDRTVLQYFADPLIRLWRNALSEM